MNETSSSSNQLNRSNLLSIINDSLVPASSSSEPSLSTPDTIQSQSIPQQHSRRRFIGARPNSNLNLIPTTKVVEAKGKGREVNQEGLNEKEQVSISLDNKLITKNLIQQQQQQQQQQQKSKLKKSNESIFTTTRSNKAKSFNSISKWQGEGFEIGESIREFERKRKEALLLRKKSETPISAILPFLFPPLTLPDHIIPLVEEPEEIYYDAKSTISPSPFKSKSTPLPLLLPPSDNLESKSLPAKSILRANLLSPPLIPNPSFLSTPVPIKNVQFSSTSTTTRLDGGQVSKSTLAGDDEPVSITEVLARPSDEAGMVIEPETEELEVEVETRLPRGEISHKELMLVQVCSTIREDLPDSYDENSSRKFPLQQSRGFEEFEVVWGRRRIELWSQRSSLFKPFRSSKKLVHTIPLHPFLTKLSLYSPTDLTFTLHYHTSSQSSQDRSLSSLISLPVGIGGNQGTNIFIFKPQTWKVAREWYWFLFLELGGKVPRELELSVPGFGVRLKFPIPEDLETGSGGGGGAGGEGGGEGEGYRSINSKIVVEACLNQLAGVSDWREMIERSKKSGIGIKLAWRRGELLDWVEDDEREKDFSFLSGFALSQPGVVSSLELRQILHSSTTVKLPSSQIISEPPSIEGYVNRIKSNGVIEKLYLSSHESFLFICKPSNAFAPLVSPPLLIRNGEGGGEKEVKVEMMIPQVSNRSTTSGSRGGKKKSGWNRFWENLTGSHEEVRPKSKNSKAILLALDSKSKEEEEILAILEREEILRCRKQILDSRGYINLVVGIKEVKLLQSIDRVEIYGVTVKEVEISRDERTFVGILANGRELKFECNSRPVAKEWVTRLNALILYWTRRTRVDAFDQMEFQPSHQFSTARQIGVDQDVSTTVGVEGDGAVAGGGRDFEGTLSPLLSKIFNRCLTDSCRSIIHHGTFYMKRDTGIYVERHLFLLPTCILEYNTKERDFSGRPTPTLFHSRVDTIHLKNSYIYSGSLASPFFTRDNLSGLGGEVGRMYTGGDGLITSDSEEDCTLVLVRKLKGDGKKGRSYVLRARSRIDRDVWVFALNSCIERLLREEASS